LLQEMPSISMGTRAKQALRRAAQWERNRLGISAIMPDCVQRPLRRMIRKRLLTEGRRFLPADRAVDFFQTLQRNGTSYIVIRWFESLPDCADGDIDFLVADDGLPDFEALLDRTPSGIPCDIYAASGVPGFSYGGIPYYPPELARRILERRVILGKGVSAPCPQDHFLSLAYHCVYRMGPDSGLPTAYRRVRPVSVPRHDYRGTLAALAAGLGLPVPIDMESLDQFLAEEGWRPPVPVLEQLAADNLWIHYHFGAAGRYRSTAEAHIDIGAP
jgi:hypothetical protein